MTWSGLDVSTTELSYSFTESGTFAGAGTEILFNGQVKIPAQVFDTPKYRLRITAGVGGAVQYRVGSETGTVASGEGAETSKDIQVFEGQTVTLEAQPKLGHGFLRWDDGTTTAQRTFVMPAGEAELRARFTGPLTVTFNPNGGEWEDGSTGDKELYPVRGEPVGPMMGSAEFALRHPSGYRFAGWYRTPDGTGEVWDLNAPVNEDMILYAGWEYNNEATLLLEIPSGVNLKNAGVGEATGTGTVKVVDSVDPNLLYQNILVKATPKIRLTNPKTQDAYDVTVWKEDGSAYIDGNQPLMKLNPKGAALPKEESFTLKTPNLYAKKKGKYEGNMVFSFSWE